MNEQEKFQELKRRILETYQKTYPYFEGNWKNFSSKDIRQLIELLEENQKERVSEKWIYTHLKPETNEKLPRKDMLDIFSKYIGFSNWDEFAYQLKNKDRNITTKQTEKVQIKRKIKKGYILLLLVPILGFVFYEFVVSLPKKTILIKNEFTKQPVNSGEMKVYQINDVELKPLEVVNSKIQVEKETEKILIESPYYQNKEINITETQKEVYVKPEDYALVLKNFIESDLKEWENRKEKLDKILSDDVEVILFLKENLGAEYLNKKEFSEKLILPTQETKNFKIVELETNSDKKITYIRIQKI